MSDDHEERFRQHEEMLQGLARMLAAQHAMNERQDVINDRLTSAIEGIDRTLAQQAEINADVKTTLARVETLFARVFRPQENGQDA